METISVEILLASGEVIHLELSGKITSQHQGSKEVTFVASGDVSLKVIDQGNRITHVVATPVT